MLPPVTQAERVNSNGCQICGAVQHLKIDIETGGDGEQRRITRRLPDHEAGRRALKPRMSY
jgi:hypothetical protein